MDIAIKIVEDKIQSLEQYSHIDSFKYRILVLKDVLKNGK